MYKLKQINFSGGKEHSINIDDDVAEQLIIHFEYLGMNMRSYYYYQIVKRNLNDIILFIDKQQNKLEDIDAIECNRLLFNYVDTLYAYINYFENVYKDDFQNIKKEIYDNYFEYRFICVLRNYMIHEDLSILCITKQYFEATSSIIFNIYTDHLCRSKVINKKIKTEITTIYTHGKIDIYPILQKQYKILKLIQEKMLISLSNDIFLRFDFISKLLVNRNELFLVKDDRIINGLLNVITKFYKDLADNFVYEENYMTYKNEIKDLFMKLSYSYYKESNVIYNPKKTP